MWFKIVKDKIIKDLEFINFVFSLFFKINTAIYSFEVLIDEDKEYNLSNKK